MDSGILDVLGTVVRALWWFWPVVSSVVLLAALVVAILCTKRGENRGAAWLMCIAWAGLTALTTFELLMWNVGDPVDYEIRRWMSHAIGLAQLACELAVGVGVVMLKPWSAPPGDGGWRP